MAVPYYPQITITPNLGLSLIGMDEVIAEDMILIDAALGGGGSGVTLQTNGVNNTLQTLLNLKSTDASMVLVADGAGGVGFSSKTYADAHLNGALITGTISLGKIPIGQTGGNVVWADPVVQGVYTEGATIAAPGAPGDLSTIQPIYIGANKAGLLSGLLLDSSGNLNVNLAAAVSNLSSNLTQLAGNAINLGSGNAGTGTQRVIIATDQPALTTPMPVVSKTSTTGGTSMVRGSIGATATAIKASIGTLYGLQIFNSNVAQVYAQLFNVAAGSVVLGTTAPIQSIGIPAGAAIVVPYNDQGTAYSTAITIAFTTSPTGLGNPPNTVEYNAQFA